MLSFAKLSTAALALATIVRADLFITSFSVQVNASTSITWTSTDPDNDPLFVSVEIQNPSFRRQFAIGTTIPTTQGSLQVATPGLIPGPGYTIQLVATNNDSTIFAETPDFTIVGNTAATSTLKAGAPTTQASPSSSSSLVSSSGTASGNATKPAATSPVATTPAGTTPAAATSPAASPSASAPATSSAGNSSSIPPPPPQTGGDAATGLVPAGTIFVMVAASVVALFL